jgi:uncharacterized protein YcfJ
LTINRLKRIVIQVGWAIFEFLPGFFVQRIYMKYCAFSLCVLSAAVVLSGCETPDGTPDRTGTGALAGGAIGIVSGALIGGRHAGEGALIGGAVGAVAGGLIGHSMDQEEQERLRAEAPETYTRVEQSQPLAVADVKAMSAAKVSDDIIISQIQSTHSVYQLSAADIIDLHNASVSEKVIQYMINSANTASASAPAPAPAETVTQAPPPPPTEAVGVAPGPGYTWVAGSWEWRGRWVWVGGYWVLPPHVGGAWVKSYWVRGPYGWHRVPGHWR